MQFCQVLAHIKISYSKVKSPHVTFHTIVRVRVVSTAVKFFLCRCISDGQPHPLPGPRLCSVSLQALFGSETRQFPKIKLLSLTFLFHWGVKIPVLCANTDSLLPFLKRALWSWRPHYSWKRHPWDTLGKQWRPPPLPSPLSNKPAKLPHKSEERTVHTVKSAAAPRCPISKMSLRCEDLMAL